MPKIQYLNDETGNQQEVSGSDRRFNVSSRSNDRQFYVSRDDGQAYVMVSTDDTLVVGEFGAYWQNTSTDKNLHILDITVNSTNSGAFQISEVTGTADGGVAITPVNLNRTSANDASANARGHGAVLRSHEGGGHRRGQRHL